MIKMISIRYFRQENNKRKVIQAVVARLLLPVIVLLCYASPGFAQTKSWQLDPGAPPEVHITGTSTLHDWKADCPGLTGIPETLQITDKNTIDAFAFKIPVDSMDGGRGATMNKKIHAAFKSTENPFIDYKQTEPAVLSEMPESGDFNFSSKGILSMAGKDKPITVSGKGTIDKGVMMLTVSKELKMTDFEMEPPSAMFGQIKTHDDIVVNFVFHYKKTGDE